jgi:adenylate kinase family enzyme
VGFFFPKNRQVHVQNTLCHNDPMSHAYIFYGKAGSGKGTQAKLLKASLESQGSQVIYIEQGANFRAFAKNPGFIENLTQSTLNSGKLMPAFMPVYLWTKALVDQFTGTEQVIFDGVARILQEASVLDSGIEFLGFDKVYVFHVTISNETAANRMKSRAASDPTHARPDDLSDIAIAARLEAYEKQVMPVIEYFKTHPRYTLVEVDGEVDVEHVFDQIKLAIG